MEVTSIKILIASDSYKGSNSSLQVAALIQEGAQKVFPKAKFVALPIADGGEGTVEALTRGLQGTIVTVAAEDPLGRPLKAFYGVLGKKAILEMAAASGLPLLRKEERNPLQTSSFGTGQILLEILKAGYRDITIGIGGSATNDGGAGLAQALGYRFLDSKGKALAPGGGNLAHLHSVDNSEISPLLKQANIQVACDVDNPLLGEQGASFVYGPQKGASPPMVAQLEAALSVFADKVEAWKGSSSLRQIPGAGAAGGLGFGLMAFCDAQITSGIDSILNLINFDQHLQDCQLVITGEGKIDAQSIHGKVPVGVARRAKAQGLPVLAIVGDIGPGASALYHHGIDAIMGSVDRVMPLQKALQRSSECLKDASERACRMLQIGMTIRANLEKEGS